MLEREPENSSSRWLEAEGKKGETGLGRNNLKTVKAGAGFSSCDRTHEALLMRRARFIPTGASELGWPLLLVSW